MHEAVSGFVTVAVVMAVIAAFAATGVSANGEERPAEGFGAESIGGEGGEVIWVTNLDDSGAGSFREAVAAEGPRIVRFRVGGIVDLKSPVVIENGRLTIDGASAADYDGITFHGAGLSFTGLACRDVIVRHIRVRRAPRAGDGIAISNGAHRILIDHCSVGWADDENFGINRGHYVTVQWCIISEGLIEGDHPKGAHSMGMLVAHGANHVTCHHNFWTGNINRNALMFGVGGYGSGGAMEGCYAGEKMAVFQPTWFSTSAATSSTTSAALRNWPRASTSTSSTTTTATARAAERGRRSTSRPTSTIPAPSARRCTAAGTSAPTGRRARVMTGPSCALAATTAAIRSIAVTANSWRRP